MIEQVLTLKYILASVVYSLIGLVILVISFVIFDWLTPGKLWEEIVEHKNLPLAVSLGAMTIAVGQIIASAIHG
jgi:uncharacterized membrane protein YjfL (UPF0719 family)